MSFSLSLSLALSLSPSLSPSHSQTHTYFNLSSNRITPNSKSVTLTSLVAESLQNEQHLSLEPPDPLERKSGPSIPLVLFYCFSFSSLCGNIKISAACLKYASQSQAKKAISEDSLSQKPKQEMSPPHAVGKHPLSMWY